METGRLAPLDNTQFVSFWGVFLGSSYSNTTNDTRTRPNIIGAGMHYSARGFAPLYTLRELGIYRTVIQCVRDPYLGMSTPLSMRSILIIMRV